MSIEKALSGAGMPTNTGSWFTLNIGHFFSHPPSWRPPWPAGACPWSPPRCTPPCWPCCGPWSRTQSAAPPGTAGCAAHRQALITLIMMRLNNQNLLNLAEIFPCRRVFRPLEHSLPEIRINILSWWQCWSEKTLLMEGGKKTQNINAGLPHLHSAFISNWIFYHLREPADSGFGSVVR